MDSVDRFETRSYRLYLDFAGVTASWRRSRREPRRRSALRGPIGLRVVLSAECRLAAAGPCARWCG